MKIIHVSDTHGTFPTLPAEGDVVVHSGDGLPNASRGKLPIEIPFQNNWIRKNTKSYAQWLNGRPMLYCMGNHCFISPCDLLQEAGINAIDITNKTVTFNGLKFCGFPYIPYLDGEWNFEKRLPEMALEIRKLKDQIANGVDVLVCHAPPYGVLDSNFVIRREDGTLIPDYGEHCGNSLLNTLLTYELEKLPKALLVGHIHEHHSVTEEWGITISNAATTVHLIEI